MARIYQVINGHKLIGDVEATDFVAGALATALDDAVTVDMLSTTLKSFLFPVAIIGAATIGYCKIGP